MKLTSREIELLGRIDTYRRDRKRGAWAAFASIAVGWLIFWYFGYLSEEVIIMLQVTLTISFVYVVTAHTEVSTEDKLIALLRRYVNNDADAIQQIRVVVNKLGTRLPVYGDPA